MLVLFVLPWKCSVGIGSVPGFVPTPARVPPTLQLYPGVVALLLNNALIAAAAVLADWNTDQPGSHGACPGSQLC